MRSALNRFEQVFWSGQSLEELYRTLSDRKTAGMGSIFVAAMREWKKSFEKGAKIAARRCRRASTRPWTWR